MSDDMYENVKEMRVGDFVTLTSSDGNACGYVKEFYETPSYITVYFTKSDKGYRIARDAYMFSIGTHSDVEDDIDEDDETELCEIAGDAYERAMRRQKARREAKQEPPCKPGDLVTLNYGLKTVITTVVQEITRCEKPGKWLIRSFDGVFYQIAPHLYRIEKVVSRFDALGVPNMPGFYRDQKNTVWKFDGKLFHPMIDAEGNPALSYPWPNAGRSKFTQVARDKGLLPLAKVTVSVED